MKNRIPRRNIGKEDLAKLGAGFDEIDPLDLEGKTRKSRWSTKHGMEVDKNDKLFNDSAPNDVKKNEPPTNHDIKDMRVKLAIIVDKIETIENKLDKLIDTLNRDSR